MKRFTGLDWLKCGAALGIVGCHLHLAPWTPAANPLMRLTDVNVGIFAAISGFLLASGLERATPGTVVGRKAARLLPVYLFWSVVYLLFATVGGGHLERFGHLWFWGEVVFEGGAYSHLWYLAALLYFTGAAALARWFCPSLLRVPALLAASAGFLALSTCGDAGTWWCYYFARLAAFACLGMALYRLRAVLTRVPVLVWIAAAVVGVVFRLSVGGPVHKFVLDYVAALPVLACCAGMSVPGEAAARKLVDLSLGVYLLHPLVSAGVLKAAQRVVSAPYGPGVLLLDWAVVALLAVAGVLVLRRIPFIRRFV